HPPEEFGDLTFSYIYIPMIAELLRRVVPLQHYFETRRILLCHLDPRRPRAFAARRPASPLPANQRKALPRVWTRDTQASMRSQDSESGRRPPSAKAAM